MVGGGFFQPFVYSPMGSINPNFIQFMEMICQELRGIITLKVKFDLSGHK